MPPMGITYPPPAHRNGAQNDPIDWKFALRSDAATLVPYLGLVGTPCKPATTDSESDRETVQEG